MSKRAGGRISVTSKSSVKEEKQPEAKVAKTLSTQVQKVVDLTDDKIENLVYDKECAKANDIDVKSLLMEDALICDGIRSVIANKDVSKCAQSPTVKLNMVSLRGMNRILQLRLKSSRDFVAAARQSAENKHLQLENLLYEVGHLEKQISACRSFRSKAESIPLVTVDEFYRDAPSSVSKPELTKNDEHEQLKARLVWELEQRKTLAQQLEDLQKEVDGTSERIAQKRAILESIKPNLKAVIDASANLGDILDGAAPLSQASKRELMEKVIKLPVKLHTAFVKLDALQNVRGKDSGISQLDVVNVQLPGEIKPDILGLTVVITHQEASIQIQMASFPQLNDLLVASSKLELHDKQISLKVAPLFENSQLLLTNLIANRQTKFRLPPSLRRLLPTSLSSAARSTLRLAFPWLNSFVGALPVADDVDEQKEYLESALSADRLVLAVQDRIHARLSLQKILADLELCQLPLASVSREVLEFPSHLGDSMKIVDFNLVGILDGSRSMSELAGGPTSDLMTNCCEDDTRTRALQSRNERGFFFLLKLSKSKHILNVHFLVPVDYPVQWPFFYLSTPKQSPQQQGNLSASELNTLLDQMENEINMKVGRKILTEAANSQSSSKPIDVLNSVLAAQISQLAACWDAVVGTDFSSELLHRRRGRDREVAWYYSSARGGYSFDSEPSIAALGSLDSTDFVARSAWSFDDNNNDGEADEDDGDDDDICDNSDDDNDETNGESKGSGLEKKRSGRLGNERDRPTEEPQSQFNEEMDTL